MADFTRTIAGREPGTRYKVRVRGESQAGVGPWREEIFETPPEPDPTRPIISRITPFDDHAVLFAPALDEGEQYEGFCFDVDTGEIVAQAVFRSQLWYMRGLRPEHSYRAELHRFFPGKPSVRPATTLFQTLAAPTPPRADQVTVQAWYSTSLVVETPALLSPPATPDWFIRLTWETIEAQPVQLGTADVPADSAYTIGSLLPDQRINIYSQVVSPFAEGPRSRAVSAQTRDLLPRNAEVANLALAFNESQTSCEIVILDTATGQPTHPSGGDFAEFRIYSDAGRTQLVTTQTSYSERTTVAGLSTETPYWVAMVYRNYFGAASAVSVLGTFTTQADTTAGSLSFTQGDTSLVIRQGATVFLRPTSPQLPQAVSTRRDAVGRPVQITHTLLNEPAWMQVDATTRRVTVKAATGAPQDPYPRQLIWQADDGTDTITLPILLTTEPLPPAEEVAEEEGRLTWNDDNPGSGFAAQQGSTTLAPSEPLAPAASTTRLDAVGRPAIVSYTVKGLPSFLSFSGTTRAFSASSAAPAQLWPVVMTLEASDGTETIRAPIVCTIHPGLFQFLIGGTQSVTALTHSTDWITPTGDTIPNVYLASARSDRSGATVTHSTENLPSFLSVDLTTRELTMTTAQTTAGEHTFQWKASDGTDTIEQTITVHIETALTWNNESGFDTQASIFPTTSKLLINDGEARPTTPRASTKRSGATVTHTMSNLPTFITWTEQPANTLISGELTANRAPTAAEVGTYTLTLTATDGTESVTWDFTIIVTASEMSWKAGGTTTITFVAGTATMTPNAPVLPEAETNIPDTDVTYFTEGTVPSFMRVDAATRRVHWANTPPLVGGSGNAAFTWGADDGIIPDADRLKTQINVRVTGQWRFFTGIDSSSQYYFFDWTAQPHNLGGGRLNGFLIRPTARADARFIHASYNQQGYRVPYLIGPDGQGRSASILVTDSPTDPNRNNRRIIGAGYNGALYITLSGWQRLGWRTGNTYTYTLSYDVFRGPRATATLTFRVVA